MNDKKKKFIKAPEDINTMNDEQVDDWVVEIIDPLIAEYKKEKKVE
jgi:hypothetical protein